MTVLRGSIKGRTRHIAVGSARHIGRSRRSVVDGVHVAMCHRGLVRCFQIRRPIGSRGATVSRNYASIGRRGRRRTARLSCSADYGLTSRSRIHAA